jgi:putative membrane protein
VTLVELPSTWARLHPMSPVARGGKAVAALAAVALPRELSQAGEGHLAQLVIDGSAAVLIVLGGVVSWLVTRWRVHDGELQLETGLLRRQSIRVPLTRVQAIDVVRPLIARVLGISELRLVMAGTGTGKAKLAYLPEERALQVRLLLLGLGEAPPPDAPPSFVVPIATVPNGRLIASTLLGAPAIISAVFLAGLVVLAFVAPAAIPSVLAGVGAAVFTSVAAVGRRINVEFSFSVGESPDGLSLHSGMLQTRAETIRLGRVQGVRLVEPWLWRRLGWCRLEVDVAQQREQEVGQEDLGKLTQALLPVGTRAEAEQLLARVLPGSVSTPPAGSGAPRRARKKAPLSYGKLATWYDERHVAARTGRLRAHTVVVPRDKIQSVRWTQGPVQRRLGLATVEVDTAGRHWKATARDRDGGDARALLWQLTAETTDDPRIVDWLFHAQP